MEVSLPRKIGLGPREIGLYLNPMPTQTPLPERPQNAPPLGLKLVQNGSLASGASTTSNVIRLRLIMGLFRLSQRDVCRATGYSKAYVSQLLAGKQFGAGDKFWLRLNACLLDAIRDSASNVFDVPPMVLPDP
jgi:hypothetical protein